MFVLFWLYFDCVNVLFDVLCEWILIIDGVMGMMIQCYGLQEQDYCGECFVGGYDYVYGFGCDYVVFEGYDLKGNNDLLLLICLQIVVDIYIVYLLVGVDLVEINMFNVILVSQVDYYLEYLVYELNKVGVVVVCVCCDVVEVIMLDKLCFVIGVIGFISCIVLISLDVNDFGFCNISFDELCDIYCEVIEGLIDGGVDIFMVEIIFDMFNVKVVLYVLEEVFDVCGVWLLVMIFGIIIDVFGCILFGQIVEVFYVLFVYV